MFTNEVSEWLSKNVPNFIDLPREAKAEIVSFSILWSFFERRVLDESASVLKIRQKIEEWEEHKLLQPNDFDNALSYFKKRYLDPNTGQPNDRFRNLLIRRDDAEDTVTGVLIGNKDEADAILAALLIIVYRYRSNFFHGMKSAYTFRDQGDNFRKANEILMKAMEIHTRLKEEKPSRKSTQSPGSR